MDDIIGIAIPILLFVVPVLISVLDARRKKAAGQKQVVSQPLAFPEEQAPEPVAGTTVRRGVREPSFSGAGVEGERAVRKRTAFVGEPDVEHRRSVDPKKLILYSELMKPKFDE